MPAGPDDAVGDDDTERSLVEADLNTIREFVAGLTATDLRSGNWFTKLLALALSAYTQKADWKYFQEKYAGLPADVIVDQRIKLASRYAAVEGGLSASAYTGTVAATIGTAGGASPLTAPAAVVTVVADVAFVTRLQLRLAYDIAVLYRVPLDLNDPADLWKLIRVAFTIKSGEAVREGVIKVVPVTVRPLIKRFYSGTVLTAAKSLPIVGKHLLQRNVIKIAIPGVGIPLAVLVNRHTTSVAGRHAQVVFRNEARVIELATLLSRRTQHPTLLLWVAWLMILADKTISDDEALLLQHLMKRPTEDHGVRDGRLRDVIDFDVKEVWQLVASELGDKQDLVDAGTRVAAVDGPINKREEDVLKELPRRCA